MSKALQMEGIHILLWAIGGGFSATLGLILCVWQFLNNKIDTVNAALSHKIDKLDEKVTDIDRRLCRLEGAFSSKDRYLKKTE